MKRRSLLAAPLVLAPTIARADAWPSRPIRVVAPDQAGSGNDLTIRLVAPHLEAALGKPIVIDNRPGAGGRIGVENAFRSPPDGYTLLIGNAGSNGINGAIYRDLPYDLERDFVPISMLVFGPNVLVVNPRVLPVASVPDLIAHLKANPGRVNFAITAPGGSAHMNTELFRVQTGTDFTNVPYRGAPDMARAMVSGESQANFNNLVNIAPQIAAGEVRVIAVTTGQRSALLPDVPTMAEQGFPDFDSAAWNGLLAPRGTPAEVIQRVHADLAKLRGNQELQARVRQLGGEFVVSSPDSFAERIRHDIAMWRSVARVANISVN
jgi:tripartite-type tricarboxylate transporter receptor subunit TctC